MFFYENEGLGCKQAIFITMTTRLLELLKQQFCASLSIIHHWMPTRMENWRRVNNFDFPRCWWFLQRLKRYNSDIHRFGIFSIRKAMNYKYYNTSLASEIMINAQWICGKVWLLVWPRDYKLLVQRWQLQKKKTFFFLCFYSNIRAKWFNSV